MQNLADRRQILRRMARRFPPARQFFLIAVAALVGGSALLFWEARSIHRRTERALADALEARERTARVASARVPLTPHPTRAVKFKQNWHDARDVALYEDFYYAATGAGLLQLDETGRLVRRWTVLDGLPESDLTALAVFQSKLYIGTAASGLVAFDGRGFEALRLENHETKAITALAAGASRLLVGTFAGGLLSYDGGALVEIRAGEARLEHITIVRESGPTLAVGTFDQGLGLRRGDVWRRATTGEGLPSNRVVGAELAGERFFVATDLGLAAGFVGEILAGDRAAFGRSLPLPMLSGLRLRGEELYLATDDGALYALAADLQTLDPARLQPVERARPHQTRGARLTKIEHRLWLLTDHGLARDAEPDERGLTLEAFGQIDADHELAENTVSALALDDGNRLWAGTFRRGIDVFDETGRRLRHLETESIRELNWLGRRDRQTMAAAASQGVHAIDATFSARAQEIGLPHPSVAQIGFGDGTKPGRTAYATAKGLVIETDGRTRFLTRAHGLPANTVNTVLYRGAKLYVGTTGGLAEIVDGRVERVYKTSNSNLKHNWITALAPAGERLFVGTYGGGVYELTAAGELRSFEAEIGRQSINPNAAAASDARICFGTLQGAFCLDLKTERWTRLDRVLPAATVLAVASREGDFYFGTTAGIAFVGRAYWTEENR